MIFAVELHLLFKHMIQINYPIADFKVKKEGDKEYIFDSIRKQWL